MTNYEKMFIDWEKRRYESAYVGYTTGNYSMMYEYINVRLGNVDANFFAMQTKKWKKVYCARLVVLYYPNKEIVEKVKKYYEKHKGEIL